MAGRKINFNEQSKSYIENIQVGETIKSDDNGLGEQTIQSNSAHLNNQYQGLSNYVV